MPHTSHAANRPELSVRSTPLRHGSMVVLSLDHLKPGEKVLLKASAQETDDVVWHDATVDQRGRLDAAVTLPVGDLPEQHWTFAMTSTERDIEISTEPMLVLPKS